jgi:hypothetical protein
MKYGDMGFDNEVIGEFEGDLDVTTNDGLFERIFTKAKLRSL